MSAFFASQRAANVLLALACLIALGPVWLASSDLSDGIIGSFAVESRLDVVLIRWLADSNWLLMIPVYRAITWIHHELNFAALHQYRLVMSASLIWIAYEVYQLARQRFDLDAVNARWAAVLLLLAPTWGILYSSIHMVIGFIALGLCGVRWVATGRTRSAQAAGVLFSLLAMQLNSNFVFLPILAVWWVWPQLMGVGRRSGLVRVALVFGCAVLVFAGLRIFHPVRADFDGYNALLTPFDAAGRLGLFRANLMFLTWALLPGLVLMCAVVLRLIRSEDRGKSVSQQGVQPWLLLAAALVLLAAAAAPYIIVGKGPPLLFPPGSDNLATRLVDQYAPARVHAGWLIWAVRQSMVFVVPMSIFLVLVALRATAVAGRVQPARAKVALGAVALVQAAMLLVSHDNRLLKDARDSTVVAALAKQGVPPSGYLELRINPSSPPPWYAVHESNYLLWRAFAQAQWLSMLTYRDDGVERAKLQGNREAILAMSKTGPPHVLTYHLAAQSVNLNCNTRIELRIDELSRWDVWVMWGLLGKRLPPAEVISDVSSGACAPRQSTPAASLAAL